MSLRLVSRALSGWRRVIGIGDQGVVWVAPCHWDCAWSGRRRGLGIADHGVVWVAPCLGLGGAVSWGLLTRVS